MQRIPEPEELMDDPAQATAYAEADFGEPNRLFVELLEEQAAHSLSGEALDLGCGPADISLDLLRRHPALHITAVDGAEAMLAHARQRLAREPELAPRLTLRCAILPDADLPAAAFDLVLSNSLLHHLGDPAVLWRTLAHAARPGAQVLVMDLARPASPAAAEALVQTHAADAPPILRRDFYNSLLAAYTVEEIEKQLAASGLAGLSVTMVSDRHLAVRGRIPGEA
ncbi:MAG: class I SAM-dependent methyltransferase [Gammaproteobacteria bacterium]|nr:MAG: class I SAM-dependent methyltransferase [Gammaproteobacteria bacterium]